MTESRPAQDEVEKLRKQARGWDHRYKDGCSGCNKCDAIDALADLAKRLESDRNEWKRQHDNLLYIYQQAIADLDRTRRYLDASNSQRDQHRAEVEFERRANLAVDKPADSSHT